MANTTRKPRSRWSGRFSEPVADAVAAYTASVTCDRRLAPMDIEASLAHARMLAAQKIIGARDKAGWEAAVKPLLDEAVTASAAN